METLQYKVIRNDAQYIKYCNKLETLGDLPKKTKAIRDEMDLLTVLIEKYDAEHTPNYDADPIELLRFLMKENKMKAVNLAALLHVGEGTVSDMLNYKKGLSKQTIRILAERFKVNQEAFNRAYELKLPVNSQPKKAKRVKRKSKVAVPNY
jgi:HTH-type transcriptional regulator/antitoxin HigA